MPNLIITADDYGLHPAVNAAIEECLSAGALRSTCVMVNMPVASAVSSLRADFPSASVGIHWTLTLGKPVLPLSEVRSLVNTDGEFHTSHEFRKRWVYGQIRRSEIHNELRAQHERFLILAGQPDYWNTHQNVHVFPVLFQTFVTMGRELGIPAMRCHRRITVPLHTTPTRYYLRHPLHWLKGQIIANWSTVVEAQGVRMPAGMLEMPDAAPGKGELEQAVRKLPLGSLPKAMELVIHPATMAEGKVFGRLTESRVKEYQVFRDPSLSDRLAQNGVITRGYEVV